MAIHYLTEEELPDEVLEQAIKWQPDVFVNKEGKPVTPQEVRTILSEINYGSKTVFSEKVGGPYYGRKLDHNTLYKRKVNKVVDLYRSYKRYNYRTIIETSTKEMVDLSATDYFSGSDPKDREYIEMERLRRAKRSEKVQEVFFLPTLLAICTTIAIGLIIFRKRKNKK